MNTDHDTIVAPATAAGGAIAVIRISGGEAFAVCDRIFRGRRPLAEADGYTVHYGTIAEGDRVIDDVLAAVFRAPHSYTGENSVEISCHGSSYIVSEILRLLTAAGGRMAQPGEFTIRAYLAGKLDLSQAEAVADMIASSSRAAHALASTQMRGGYSEELESLREKLLNLTSLLELELDFSEEDVEFADRTALRATMQRIAAEIDRLRSSFALGNAIREGVAVAIAGVAGYTQPSQDFGNALRLWRFLLAILASLGGLFGLALGWAALIYHLAGLETFGVPYLAPFTSGGGRRTGHPTVVRPPLGEMKWRDGALYSRNRRNQR